MVSYSPVTQDRAQRGDLGVAVLAAIPRWRQRAFTATALASIGWTVAGVVWWRRGWPNGWGPRPSPLLPLSAAATSLVIRHTLPAGRADAPDPALRAQVGIRHALRNPTVETQNGTR